MSPKTIAICLACLAAGLVAGRLLPREVRIEHPQAADFAKGGRTSGARTLEPTRAWSSRAGAESADTGTSGEHRPSDPLPDAGFGDSPERLVVVPAALLAELSLSGSHRTLDQALFSEDGRIEELLRITDREKAGVQTAWRESRQKVRDLETASALREPLEDGSLRITLPDLSAARKRVGDQFGSSLKGILGENRGETFLAAKQIGQVFESAEGEHTYLVSPEEIGDGRWRFRMTLEDAGGQRVWVGETIPNELRHLVGDARLVAEPDTAADASGR